MALPPFPLCPLSSRHRRLDFLGVRKESLSVSLISSPVPTTRTRMRWSLSAGSRSSRMISYTGANGPKRRDVPIKCC